jgi:hypothetical protein|tara:strand:+ start:193 stop:405 length:213 start_codon:yes stop_codon:yes gene_type:complete
MSDNELVEMIAYLRMGGIRHYFDKVTVGYEISWLEDGSHREYSFEDLKTAREFWHTEVVDRYQVKHCYCC